MGKPELLPCPWCSSLETPHLYEEPLEDGAHCKRWSLMCPECHARGPEYIAPFPDKEGLVPSWNRRIPTWTKIEDCPEEWADGRFCVGLFSDGKPRTIAYDRPINYWIDSHGRLAGVDKPYVTHRLTHIMPLPAAPEVK